MRYDGTTLRDGEHDLIVYKVNVKSPHNAVGSWSVASWYVCYSLPACQPARPTHAPCVMTTTEMSVKNWPVPAVAAIIKVSLPIESCVACMHRPPQ